MDEADSELLYRGGASVEVRGGDWGFGGGGVHVRGRKMNGRGDGIKKRGI